MLVLVGLGLAKNQLTLEGLQEAKTADLLFLETYTSKVLNADRAWLESLLGKPVKEANREFVESGKPLEEAKNKKVILLVPGDPMIATTHSDLLLRAREQGIVFRVVHAPSIINAVTDTGLQFYKFGKSTTAVLWDDKNKPTSFYDVIAENKKRGLHTLVFLDIKAGEPGRNDVCMTANQAISQLLKIEEQKKQGVITPETLLVVCARMGTKEQKIVAGNASDLEKQDFGPPLHLLVVPGELHFTEKEFLDSPSS